MAKKVITQQQARLYIQAQNGTAPLFVTEYMLSGVEVPGSEGERINMPSPLQRGQYIEEGRTFSAPDIASGSLMVRLRKGGLPKWIQYIRAGLSFNLYVQYGSCASASDFLAGWEQGHVLVVPDCVATSKNFGDLNAYDEDSPREVEFSFQMGEPFHIGSIALGEVASSNIATEVLDVAWSTAYSDGTCGARNVGDQWAASLNKAATGAKPSITYTNDKWATSTNLPIAVAANDEVVSALAYNDKYIVVCSTLDKYYVSEASSAGVPAAFVAVTTGVVATSSPLDVYFLEGNTFIMSAELGYVYKTTNPLNGVTVLTAGGVTAENLTRVTASPDGTVLAAAGEDGAFIYSLNEGGTWTAPANAPVSSGTNVLSIGIIDGYRFFAGLSSGVLMKTINAGASAWSTVSFSGSGAGTVNDFKVLNDQVMYFLHATATPDARVFSCWDGGNEFARSTPRFVGLQVEDRYNRIAFPRNLNLDERVNTVLLGGLDGAATDGCLYLGSGVYV